MATELYKIEYVEMNPAQAEESDDLEFLEVIAEVDGDAFDAINFWWDKDQKCEVFVSLEEWLEIYSNYKASKGNL